MAYKEMTATLAFKDLTKIINKLKTIATEFCIDGDGNITVKRNNGWESLIVPNSNLYLGKRYFAWLACTVSNYLDSLKEKDIKVKGTTIDDCIDSVEVYKEGVKLIVFNKLLGTMDDNHRIAMSFYKYLPVYFDELQNDNNWIILGDDDKKLVSDGMTINITKPGTDEFVILSKDSFPLAKADTPIKIKFLGDLIGLNGVKTDYGCIGIIEDYDLFQVVSIGGYIRL